MSIFSIKIGFFLIYKKDFIHFSWKEGSQINVTKDLMRLSEGKEKRLEKSKNFPLYIKLFSTYF